MTIEIQQTNLVSPNILKQLKKRSKTDYILVHHSANTEKQDIGAAEINLTHIRRGYTMGGYHYVIRRNGNIEALRPQWSHGAHCYDRFSPKSWPINGSSLAICMIGGVSSKTGKASNNFTERQWNSLENLVIYLQRLFPGAKVAAHRKFMATQCPAFDVTHWAKEKGLEHA